MPIQLPQFVQYYPRLYHMAEVDSWPSIRKHGLLSTTALLDLFEVSGTKRRALEREHRPNSVTITHPKHGQAVIRDQKPLRQRALAECLVGMTPEQWYRILNRYVFFWITEERLKTLLLARAYRDKTHTVLTIDTARLLETNAKAVRLSPINSGSTIYNPRPRGADTFQRMSTYPFDERRRLRGLQNAVAELAVSYSVSDIARSVLSVAHYKNGRSIETLYP